MCHRAKIAREARFATQDAKRRKMREELEKRERTVAAARDEEAAARAKLKVRGGLPEPWSTSAHPIDGAGLTMVSETGKMPY